MFVEGLRRAEAQIRFNNSEPAKPAPKLLGHLVRKPVVEGSTPNGPDLPTVVTFRNEGTGQAALLQRVCFIGWTTVPTPSRPKLFGVQLPKLVVIERRHFLKTKEPNLGHYEVRLTKPMEIPPGENGIIELAFVDPQQVGKTLIGTIKLVYDNGQEVTLSNVELDVLREAPEEPQAP